MEYDFNQTLKRKGTASIKWDCQEEIYGKGNLLPFFIADSDYPTEPRIIESIIARARKDGLGYSDADAEYYSTLTSWFKTQHNTEVQQDWVLPLSGVVCAMSYILTVLTEGGAAVVVQPPVYNPFYTIVNACGKQPVLNNLLQKDERYTIDFPGLETAFKAGAKALLFCSPHNPVGRVWLAQELEQIVYLCKKYNVLLVADEIHCDLVLHGHRFISLLQYINLYENIIVCTSPGKTFNLAGLQCANIMIPNQGLRQKLSAWLGGHYIFTPNIFALEACKAAYNTGKQWAAAQNRHLQSNYQIVKSYFDSNFPQAKIAPLEGTFLMWLNLTYTGCKSNELVEEFVQHGIALNSGTVYGPQYEGYVRLNIACPTQQFQKGLQKIGTALSAL